MDNEELIDYEDEHDIAPTTATGNAGGAIASGDGTDGATGEKKSYAGIHSTGFRYFSIAKIRSDVAWI